MAEVSFKFFKALDGMICVDCGEKADTIVQPNYPGPVGPTLCTTCLSKYFTLPETSEDTKDN